MLYRLLLVVMFAVVSLALPRTAQAADDVGSISREIVCQCGCTMIVDVCDCGTADQMQQVIRQRLSEGQGSKQIIDYFVSQYGEKVLGSPKKEGFNLAAYLLPFAAIAVAGGGITAASIAWVRRGATSPIPTADAELAGEDAGDLMDELEQDLAQMEREEDGRQ
ncbi:MAG: cytochrome c-type biogenesis protein [Chloroflexota bacterium]